MFRLLFISALVVSTLAACPNQCSGNGRCSENDKCVCFKQQGLYTPYRYGFSGADCSLRSCPLGAAYDTISAQVPKITEMSFKSATGTSNAKLSALFIESSMSTDFTNLKSDRKFIVQIMTVDPSPTSQTYGTFAWRFEDDNFFSTEATIGSFMSAQAPYTLSNSDVQSTGVFIYWDDIKGATPAFTSVPGQIAEGDIYEFKIAHDFVNTEVGVFDSYDGNTAHQLVECSGRGTCDSAAGKCRCLPGYSGEACQRTVCPNSCSGHGSCQTELRFAVYGMAENAGNLGNYEKDQQYGCKCDAGYRGPDCSMVECPSGRDVMGADGGAEGMDCSGRGLCDYSVGTCACFKGFYGERCEQQTTLV